MKNIWIENIFGVQRTSEIGVFFVTFAKMSKMPKIPKNANFAGFLNSEEIFDLNLSIGLNLLCNL